MYAETADTNVTASVCMCLDFADNFWATVCKRFALSYRTVVCLSVLSVTLVYCGQTVGWIKMKLGMQVGLGPVRWGTSSPPPQGE